MFILLIGGTLAYKILLNIALLDAFYLTLESLAFLADIEGYGRVLQVFLSIVGLFIVWWALWSIFDIIFSQTFKDYLLEKKISREVNHMKQHYIILGGGRVGDEIARQLKIKKANLIVVESDAKIVRDLRKIGILAILGDATDEDVLKKAKVSFAKSIIVALPQAEKNVLAVLLCKELNPGVPIYARSQNDDYVSVLKKAGATKVIIPTIAAANEILREMGE